MLHQKPCGLLNVAGYFDGLLAFIGHGIEEGFVRWEYRGMIAVSESVGELLELMATCEAPRVEKWIDRAAT